MTLIWFWFHWECFCYRCVFFLPHSYTHKPRIQYSGALSAFHLTTMCSVFPIQINLEGSLFALHLFFVSLCVWFFFLEAFGFYCALVEQSFSFEKKTEWITSFFFLSLFSSHINYCELYTNGCKFMYKCHFLFLCYWIPSANYNT